MAEQATRLNEAAISRLSTEVVGHFTLDAQGEFQRRSTTFLSKQAEIAQFKKASDEAIMSTRKDLAGPQTVLTAAYDLLERATEEINLEGPNKHPRGLSQIKWGHLQVALYENWEHLPSIVRFAAKRWIKPTPVHPQVEPYLILNYIAVDYFEQQIGEVAKKEEQIDSKLGKVTQAQLKELAQARNRLFATCEANVGNDAYLVETYVGILPQRAHAASLAFAEKQYLTADQLANLPDFLQDRRVSAYKHYFKSLEGLNRDQIAEVIVTLDPRALTIWKTWTAYKMEENLAAANESVKKPAFPSF